MWLSTEDERLTRALAGKTLVPRLALDFRLRQVTAVTVRGTYHIIIGQSGEAWPYFHPWAEPDRCEILPGAKHVLGAERVCLDHARALPDYPVLLSWLAGFELPSEVEHVTA